MTRVAMTQRETVLAALQAATGNAVCGNDFWGRYGARVHELRAEGHNIVTETCHCKRCRNSRSRQKRLGMAPTYVGAYRLVPAQVDAA